ncbi:VC0807 family protein [Actinoallomurus soli]|uniref:VC0807 family protein n=1 Tax=Actinoallomurus soli TaxID=2952535 RepID=UPI0020925F2E|nr:VC0807 family protein [Actinoallomurus soli]MCO5968244.1 hypothetical protein [Actinoallomurus soli]
MLRRLLPSLLVNAVGASAVYFGLARWRKDDVLALAVATGIPIAWTLGRFAVRRTVDPVGVLVAAGYGLAVLVSILTNGSPIALELHEPALTGLLGLACLLSVVVRRPLHGVLLHILTRRNPGLPTTADDPARRRLSTVVTALVGGTLLVHAATLVVLALTVSLDNYMLLRHPVGLPILGLGAAALAWHRHVRHQPGQAE